MFKRLECLERIRLQSPRLPLALQLTWERRELAYCKRCPEYYTDTTGSQFINKGNLLVATLGNRYGGYLRVEEQQSENEKNELKKYQKKTNDPRAFEDFVIGLAAWVPKSMIRCAA